MSSTKVTTNVAAGRDGDHFTRLSDPVDLTVAPLGSLAIGLYLAAARGRSQQQWRDPFPSGANRYRRLAGRRSVPTDPPVSVDDQSSHPGDSGYKAMADSIDLKMLTTQP